MPESNPPANTFCSLNIHCIFSTKERVPMLNPELRERLWPFLGGIAKQNGIKPRCIGGVADHVHLLLSLPTTVPIAKAIQLKLIKAGSSAWIHQTFRQLDNFSWQQGYGAFSVSVSQLPETIHYIQNQVEHHRTRTFQQEYVAFLKRHELSFDDKYSLGLTMTSAVPPGRGVFLYRYPGFVPGYYHAVPPGQNTFIRRGFA